MGNFAHKPSMKRYEIITTERQLKKLCFRMNSLQEFAFDTETSDLRAYGRNKDFRCIGISISWGEYNNYYIPLNHLREEDLDSQLDERLVVKYLRPNFEREDITLAGSNLKWDMHVMMRLGVHIRTKKLFDTMIASWLCDENTPNGLKENSLYRLHINQTHFKDVTETVPKDIRKQFGLKSNSRVPFSLVLIEDGAPYALADAFNSWELYLGFMLELEDEGMDKIYRKLYQPAIRTFFDMEEAGVSVDVKEIERMRVEMTKDLDALSYRLFELSGCVFNPNSSQQLTMLLFGIKPDKESKSKSKKQKEEYDSLSKILMDNNFGFKPIGFTKKGAISTDNDTIYTLANKDYKDKHRSRGVELCKVLLDYKKLYKLKTAFVDGLLEQMYDDGKVHPTFNINGASSGRLSCQNPNLQQLPKAHEEDKYQIRSVFRGSEMPDGRRKKIIALDFSNLEMRVLAHWSLDKNLLTMFANGDDVHGSTAVNMFELKCTPAEVKKLYADLRQAAKIINFMLSYGGGARALYEALKNDHYSPIDLGDKVLEFRQKYPHRTVRNGIDVAQIYIDTYFAKYSGVADFIKSQKRFAHHNGYVLTLLGRKRRLPDINSEDGETRSYCERLSVNGCIQGSASDITESAQNRIAKDPWFYEHNCIMLIQVHDELVFECPEEYVEEAIPKIKWYMEHPFGDKVKLNLDFIAESGSGDNYQQAK